MGVELPVYGVSTTAGSALYVPERVLDTYRAVGERLTRRPFEVQIALLAPADAPFDALSEATLLTGRRAATAATLSKGAALPGPGRRWRAVLIALGWLLLLSADQSTAQVLAGVWLGIVFPALYGLVDGTRRTRDAAVADALAAALDRATVVFSPHAGVEQWSAAAQESLDRGVMPDGIWAPYDLGGVARPEAADAGEDLTASTPVDAPGAGAAVEPLFAPPEGAANDTAQPVEAPPAGALPAAQNEEGIRNSSHASPTQA